MKEIRPLKEALTNLLPKIKIIQEPLDQREEAVAKLRQYFKMFHKRRNIRSVLPTPPKYTLFLKPFPCMLPYIPADEKSPWKPEFYTSFRVAHRRYVVALREIIKQAGKQTRASML